MLTPPRSVPSIKCQVELRSRGLIGTGEMEITLDAIMANSKQRGPKAPLHIYSIFKHMR